MTIFVPETFEPAAGDVARRIGPDPEQAEPEHRVAYLRLGVPERDQQGHPGGHVRIALENDGVELCVQVEDDGVGLPPGFSLERNSSLGLTIVAALVDSEMSGTISMESRPDGDGTVVELRIPVHPATVTG